MATHSISRKFLFRLLLVLFLGQIVIGAWSYMDRRTTGEENLQRKATVQARMLAAIASRSMSDFDFTYLGVVVDETMKDPDIRKVTLADKDGTALLENGTKAKGEDLRTIEVPVMVGGDAAAKLVVRYSGAGLHKRLLHQLLLNVALQVGVFFVLSLTILFFFRRHLGKKIAAINEAIEHIREGDLTRQIPSLGDDEFGDIAKGLNFMADQLHSTVSRLASIGNGLASAMESLNANFATVGSSARTQQQSTEKVLNDISDASAAQQRILDNTNSLAALSQANSTALDEISSTFTETEANIDSLNVNVNVIYSTIAQLNQSAKGVASVVDNASSAAADTAGSVRAINDLVQTIDGAVTATSSLSDQVIGVVSEKGIVQVENAIASMEQIKSFVSSLTMTMSQLDTRSKDVAKILAVIREVTDQAHLLSLNAQIIAGQAGEHGRSFAVVANEMKLHSAKTAASTKEIESIIQAIRGQITAAVDETHNTFLTVTDGSRIVSSAGAALHEVLDASRRSAEMVKGIELSTKEQSRLASHILGVVSKLETVNREVKRATDEEVQSIVYLEEGLRAIRDSMEVTRSATQEQGASLEVITGNIQSANAKTGEIAAASLQQKNVNGLISESMRTIMAHGGNTLAAVQDAAGRISTIYRDVELLRREMGMFRVSDQQSDQLADEPGDQLSEQLAVDTRNEKGYTTTGLDTNVSSRDV